MLGKVLDGLNPRSNISVNIHTESEEQAKKVFEVLSEAGYPHKVYDDWTVFHMPGAVSDYANITVF